MIKRQALIPSGILIAVIFSGVLFFLLKPKKTISPLSSEPASIQNKVLEIQPSAPPIVEDNNSNEENQEVMDSNDSNLEILDEDVILEEEIIE